MLQQRTIPQRGVTSIHLSVVQSVDDLHDAISA